MEEEKERQTEKTIKEVKDKVEEKINTILENGIDMNNLEVLDKLVDIHKDMSNEEYWNEKKEGMKMRYRGYEGYGEGGYSGYGEGGYGEGGYGRRGVRGSGRGRRRYSAGGYSGEEMMDEMYGAYQAYSEGKEEYSRGNYGAKPEAMKSLDAMLQSVTEFFQMLKQDASSQEEMQLIQKYTKKISEM